MSARPGLHPSPGAATPPSFSPFNPPPSTATPPSLSALPPPGEPDAYQRILEKAYRCRIPITAHWELTYRCNLSCVHCYNRGHPPGRELAGPEIERVLDELAQAGCLYLVLTGGEICCRADLPHILGAARDRGFALRIMTNGTLLTSALADELAAAAPLAVDISLYAAGPDIHDAITGVSGSWAKTRDAARMCIDRGLRVILKTVFMRQNAEEYPALVEYARSLGAGFVFDYVLVPADNGAARMTEHGLDEEALCRFLAARLTAADARAASVPVRSASGSQPLCGAGSSCLAISPEGAVFPCLAFRRGVGSLRERSLAQIWASPALATLRQARYDELERCGVCEWAAFCNRCPGVALAECGNMLGCPESACRVARATKRACERMDVR